MKMYEIGRRYKWWREVGPYAFLNGTECTVTHEPIQLNHPAGFVTWCQQTDSWMPSEKFEGKVSPMMAMRGDLLPLEDEPELQINEHSELTA